METTKFNRYCLAVWRKWSFVLSGIIVVFGLFPFTRLADGAMCPLGGCSGVVVNVITEEGGEW